MTAPLLVILTCLPPPGMICCEDSCSEGGFSYDDIDLWSRLRSISLVKVESLATAHVNAWKQGGSPTLKICLAPQGAEFPPKLKAYMDKYAEIGDVPLYWNMQV